MPSRKFYVNYGQARRPAPTMRQIGKHYNRNAVPKFRILHSHRKTPNYLAKHKFMCYHKLTNIFGDDFMNKISKILSIILTLIMVSSIISMSAITSNAATSGKCGDNVTWSYVASTGSLTIFGTGAMYNYDGYNRPWEDYEDDIKKVVINNGVTTIGEYVFYDCNSLTSLTIGDSVTTIGHDAFAHCYSLTSITIPNSVTTIGDDAFACCNNLTSVTIPDSVTTIDGMAFFGCNSLTSVIIPDSVIIIGYWAFNCCGSLTSITVDSNNQYYSSDEYGVLFNKDKTTLIQYPVGNTRINYTIPDSVTAIADGAFCHCDSLEGVIIPDSVTIIGVQVFGWNFKLKIIHYLGTEEEWEKISIGVDNEKLKDLVKIKGGNNDIVVSSAVLVIITILLTIYVFFIHKRRKKDN